MNKKVIIIATLTLSALVVLTLFAFGPLSGPRQKTAVNPASLNPVQQIPVQNSSSPQTQPVNMQTYSNVDVKENYYQISIPKEWKISTGSTPGGYSINLSGGNGEVRLMDVPDNTTLELYVLSQEEPRLKKLVSGYQRLDYQKLTVNGNEAYEIIYSSGDNQNMLKTIVVYIAGQDHAGVISLTTALNNFPNLQATFNNAINSFNWQNK